MWFYEHIKWGINSASTGMFVVKKCINMHRSEFCPYLNETDMSDAFSNGKVNKCAYNILLNSVANCYPS